MPLSMGIFSLASANTISIVNTQLVKGDGNV